LLFFYHSGEYLLLWAPLWHPPFGPNPVSFFLKGSTLSVRFSYSPREHLSWNFYSSCLHFLSFFFFFFLFSTPVGGFNPPFQFLYLQFVFPGSWKMFYTRGDPSILSVPPWLFAGGSTHPPVWGTSFSPNFTPLFFALLFKFLEFYPPTLYLSVLSVTTFLCFALDDPPPWLHHYFFTSFEIMSWSTTPIFPYFITPLCLLLRFHASRAFSFPPPLVTPPTFLHCSFLPGCGLDGAFGFFLHSY